MVRARHCAVAVIGLSLGLCAPAAFPATAGCPPGVACAPSPAADTTACNQVYACVQRFRADLERLRRVMGKPVAADIDMGIRSAAPHDAYFQALDLLKSSERLAFELTRTGLSAPPPPGSIPMIEVRPVVQRAHQALREVMATPWLQASGLATLPPVEIPPAAGEQTPTSVFLALLAANRQLNLLLDRHFDPADVYMEVTLAVGYAARLLARYPDADRLPEEPVFEPAKQPGDVYRRLLDCLQMLARIMTALDLEAAVVDTGRVDSTAITPGDNLLIASLVVSQLDLLHRHLRIADPPRQVYFPGRKLPAHVYQRAGLLQAQLQQLEQRVRDGLNAPTPNR